MGCIPDQKLEKYNLQIEFQLLLDSPKICDSKKKFKFKY